MSTRPLANPHGHTTTFLSPDGSTVKKIARDEETVLKFDSIVWAWKTAASLQITPPLLHARKKYDAKNRLAVFVYKFQRGVDLYAWWKKNGKNRARSRRVEDRCAHALSLLHDRGIVFGDVNAGNFLVDELDGDRVYLIDWETVATRMQDMHYLQEMFARLKATHTTA